MEQGQIQTSFNTAIIDGNLCSNIVVTPPGKPAKRSPAAIICVLDISGSMDSQATQGQSKESDGFSRLDLVKHSVNTIIHSLSEGDSLGIVTFSDKARLDMPITEMNENGRKKALAVVKKMHSQGSTNLWDGIKMGLEQSSSNQCESKNTFVVVLSDGEPNQHPPGGELAALDNYIMANPLTCSLNMFGYGYNLNTKLLAAISEKGAGCYGYIPDCSMVGTIFVNFLSNSLSAYNTLLTVEVTSNAGTLVQLNGSPISKAVMGPIQFGCQRNIYVSYTDFTEGQDVAVLTLRYGKNLRETKSIKLKAETTGDTNSVKVQRLRYKYISKLAEVTEMATNMNYEFAKKQIQELVSSMQKTAQETKDEYLLELIKDMHSDKDDQGQVKIALSTAEFWTKWGKHYLPALRIAHGLEMCTNFKDPGLQKYGGALFREIENTIDSVFIKLPPPDPTIKKYDEKGNLHKVNNMAHYYNQYGGCIGGDCLVSMSDGKQKLVKDLRKGDQIKTPNGISKIKCVLVTNINQQIEMVEFKNGLLITNYHPIIHNNKWQFPININRPIRIYIQKYYNFVLQSGYALIVNGISCATLGHQLKGQIIQHHYLGTRAVINDLQKLYGWNQGFVAIHKQMLKRDPISHLIIKITA